jgi:hypothetical protein
MPEKLPEVVVALRMLEEQPSYGTTARLIVQVVDEGGSSIQYLQARNNCAFKLQRPLSAFEKVLLLGKLIIGRASCQVRALAQVVQVDHAVLGYVNDLVFVQQQQAKLSAWRATLLQEATRRDLCFSAADDHITWKRVSDPKLASPQNRGAADLKLLQGLITEQEHRQVLQTAEVFDREMGAAATQGAGTDADSSPRDIQLALDRLLEDIKSLEISTTQAVLASVQNCFALAQEHPAALKEAASIAERTGLGEDCRRILSQVMEDYAEVLFTVGSAAVSADGADTIDDAVDACSALLHKLRIAFSTVAPCFADSYSVATLFQKAATDHVEATLPMLLTNSAGIKKLLWGEELQEHELNSNLNMKNRLQMVNFLSSWNRQAREHRLPNSIMLRTAVDSLLASYVMNVEVQLLAWMENEPTLQGGKGQVIQSSAGQLTTSMPGLLFSTFDSQLSAARQHIDGIDLDRVTWACFSALNNFGARQRDNLAPDVHTNCALLNDWACVLEYCTVFSQRFTSAEVCAHREPDVMVAYRRCLTTFRTNIAQGIKHLAGKIVRSDSFQNTKPGQCSVKVLQWQKTLGNICICLHGREPRGQISAKIALECLELALHAYAFPFLRAGGFSTAARNGGAKIANDKTVLLEFFQSWAGILVPVASIEHRFQVFAVLQAVFATTPEPAVDGPHPKLSMLRFRRAKLPARSDWRILTDLERHDIEHCLLVKSLGNETTKDLLNRPRRIDVSFGPHMKCTGLDDTLRRAIDLLRAVGDFADLSEGTFSENALSEACIAVDALGRSMRTKFVDLFVSDLLEIYRLKFAGSSKLQHVTWRFSWFHRVLRTLEIVLASVFPAHWHVPIEFCIQFCVHTRVSVLAELDAVERSAEIDVTSMLQALHKTLAFENEITTRFEAAANGGSINRDAEFKGKISSCFEPYLTAYISLEQENMGDMIRRASATEAHLDRDETLQVFQSSVRMFRFIKSSTKRCTALTTGLTFFNLVTAFQDFLSAYAGALSLRLPGEALQLSVGQELDICYVSTTCHYCAENVLKLQPEVQGRIDHAYQDAIGFDEQAGIFEEIAAFAVRRLIDSLTSKLDQGFLSMTQVNWAGCRGVGDMSSYSVELGRAVPAQSLAMIRSVVDPACFLYVCEQVGSVVRCFHYMSVRCFQVRPGFHLPVFFDDP